MTCNKGEGKIPKGGDIPVGDLPPWKANFLGNQASLSKAGDKNIFRARDPLTSRSS